MPDWDHTYTTRCHGNTQVQQLTQKPQLHMLSKILLVIIIVTGQTFKLFFSLYRYTYFCMLTVGPSVQGKIHSNSPEGFLKYLLSLGFLLQVLVSKERICQGWKCHHLSHWGRKSCDFPNNIIKSHLFTNWAADFWRIAIWHACNYLPVTRILSKNPKGWFSSLFLMHHGRYFGHQE